MIIMVLNTITIIIITDIKDIINPLITDILEILGMVSYAIL